MDIAEATEQQGNFKVHEIDQHDLRICMKCAKAYAAELSAWGACCSVECVVAED